MKPCDVTKKEQGWCLSKFSFRSERSILKVRNNLIVTNNPITMIPPPGRGGRVIKLIGCKIKFQSGCRISWFQTFFSNNEVFPIFRGWDKYSFLFFFFPSTSVLYRVRRRILRNTLYQRVKNFFPFHCPAESYFIFIFIVFFFILSFFRISFLTWDSLHEFSIYSFHFFAASKIQMDDIW